MTPVDILELQRLRELHALEALECLGAYVKFDRDFTPMGASSTRRVHVNIGGRDLELLIDGPKFYDTRAKKGGGGAIDLVMYLWGVRFKEAFAMLQEAKP